MNDRRSKILVTCGARIPSVELGAMIPLSHLQSMGYCELSYRDEIDLSLADIAWCDILFVVRGASRRVLQIAECAKKLQRKVVGYWDDDLLNIPSYSLVFTYYSMPETRRIIGNLFTVTDLFFSPSSNLAVRLSAIHRKEAKVLPVPFGMKELKPPNGRNHSVPIVGYAGGPDHIQLLHSFLGPVFDALMVSDINVNIHMVGPRPDFIDKLGQRAIWTSYIENYHDYLEFASRLNWDVGVAPQVDSEFTACKFYNKLLEYTSIGCAGIYSKLEPYASVIQDGITGLLADNELRAWRDALLRLLRDSKLRCKIADNAHEFVQNFHNRHVVAEKYASALEPFLGYRAPKISHANGTRYLIEGEETIVNLENSDKSPETTIREKGVRLEEFEMVAKDSETYISHLEGVVRDQEATLNHIYNSRGWKFLVSYYKTRDKLAMAKSYIGRKVILISQSITSLLRHFRRRPMEL